MNRYQSNKMNSFEALKGVLAEYQKTWTAFPALAKVVEEFHSLVDEIETVAARRELDTTGETLAKNNARKEMARHASIMAAAGMAYAFDHSDPELEASLDYSYSEIEHGKDADALLICGGIFKVLNRDLPDLEDYMVSKEDIRELDRLMKRFEDAMKRKGAEKSRRVADTKALSSLFRSSATLLSRKMDRLMLSLKEEHPGFYNAYSSARTITDH